MILDSCAAQLILRVAEISDMAMPVCYEIILAVSMCVIGTCFAGQIVQNELMRKALKAKDAVIANLSPADQRYYAVYLYQQKHGCSLAKAYQAIYDCSEASAQAASSRLSKTEAWLTLSQRMEEAALHSKDSIKIEITAAMLSILHNPKAYPGDKAKAAAQLAQIYDLNNHNISLHVDAVTQYAQQSLALSADEPLIAE